MTTLRRTLSWSLTSYRSCQGKQQLLEAKTESSVCWSIVWGQNVQDTPPRSLLGTIQLKDNRIVGKGEGLSAHQSRSHVRVCRMTAISGFPPQNQVLWLRLTGGSVCLLTAEDAYSESRRSHRKSAIHVCCAFNLAACKISGHKEPESRTAPNPWYVA